MVCKIFFCSKFLDVSEKVVEKKKKKKKKKKKEKAIPRSYVLQANAINHKLLFIQRIRIYYMR